MICHFNTQGAVRRPKEVRGLADKLKPGDKVIMHDCYEARKYGNKVWIVGSQSWDLCGSEVVKLEGKTGGFAIKFLHKVADNA